ncbi:hypothetical protein SPHINGOR109_10130 [Sphingorhabdus sp. 109]|nr:hypothetical protein SPHINGOR109_10130 [Sphingorhabdus sp. 109]
MVDDQLCWPGAGRCVSFASRRRIEPASSGYWGVILVGWLALGIAYSNSAGRTAAASIIGGGRSPRLVRRAIRAQSCVLAHRLSTRRTGRRN